MNYENPTEFCKFYVKQFKIQVKRLTIKKEFTCFVFNFGYARINFIYKYKRKREKVCQKKH